MDLRELFEKVDRLEKKMSNMIKQGVAHEIDKNRIKIKAGNFVSGWLTVMQPMAGEDQEFNPVTKGELFLALYPGGVVESGYALRGASYDSMPLPSEASDKVFVKKFSDGSKITYDKESHELNADIKGKIKIKNYDNIEIETAKEMSFKNGISELKIGLGAIELKGIAGPTFGILTEMSKCPVFGVGLLPASVTAKASL